MSRGGGGANVDGAPHLARRGGTGQVATYGELEDRSCRVANLFRSFGLRPGGHVAVLLENCVEYFEVVWGALRAGIYVTPINWHLSADEAAYIVEDCGASVLVASSGLGDLVGNLTAPRTSSCSTRR